MDLSQLTYFLMIKIADLPSLNCVSRAYIRKKDLVMFYE